MTRTEPKLIRAKDLEFIPASHEDPKNPGVYKKILAAKDDLISGQVQMINWAMMPVGQEFSNHYHEDMEEVFVILSGNAEILINDRKYSLEQGDAIIIPPLCHHKMRNLGECPVEYLVVGVSQGRGGKTVLV